MIIYEKLDVYDENRNKTGRIIERKEGEILSSDEYILAIQYWIINSNIRSEGIKIMDLEKGV